MGARGKHVVRVPAAGLLQAIAQAGQRGAQGIGTLRMPVGAFELLRIEQREREVVMTVEGVGIEFERLLVV